ncbi:MAG: N-acetyltransferase [bacterium]|nr:N-acetyltransferase [Planctomycetota bacterium]
MIVRPEGSHDLNGIRAVHEAAFGSSLESGLVDALRDGGKLFSSMLAIEEAEVRGHVATSLVTIEFQGEALVAGVAPLGVLPAHQRRGIGSALMWSIITAAREAGCAGLVLLGDPAYYGRFGFEPAATFDLRSHYTDGPAFQALALDPGAWADCRGQVRYDTSFDELD